MLSRRGKVWVALLVSTALVAALALTAVIVYRAGRPSEPAAAQPSPSPRRSTQLTVAEIYEAVAPSVVSIKAGEGLGTGLVVNADGSILTAYHVVKGATEIEVTFADGTKSVARIEAAEDAMDIAVLTPATLPQLVVPAVLGGGAAVGDEVVAIGNQLALTLSTTSGVVSGLDRSIAREDGAGALEGLIQFDAAVNPGSSGGPLVNAKGQTIGIVVALANPTKSGTFIGVGFAVPIATAVGGGRPPQL